MSSSTFRRGRALVTGATGGIGEAAARRLAADGFLVYAGGRNVGRLKKLATAVGGVPLPFDLTSEADIRKARSVAAADGAIDVVVNCAGVFDLAPVAATGEDVLQRNLDVNLKGAFHLVRAFLPDMIKAGRGLIVTVGSVAGRRAFPDNAAYAASKYGVRGFHEVLLEELRGIGVRACLLEPGAVDTRIWDAHDPGGSSSLPPRTAMLRPQDVALAVSFLASLPDHVSVPFLPVEKA